MLRRVFGRLLLIPFALSLSLLTAMGLISYFVLERLEKTVRDMEGATQNFFIFWQRADLHHIGFPHLIVVLIFAVVVLGELLHLRSMLYYIVTFGASLGLFSVVAPSLGLGAFYIGHEGLWQIFTTSGFTAGFVYWILAGRTA